MNTTQDDQNQDEKIPDQTGDQSQNDNIETLRTELLQMTELAKRTMADLQNLRRRQDEERRLIITMANVDLVKSLLPILDNLERGIEHAPETDSEWFKGMEISVKQLQKTMQDNGLKPIEAVGQKFNPDLHEALAHTEGEKDMVIEELEKGYMLGDRVIRHSKVKVGSGI